MPKIQIWFDSIFPSNYVLILKLLVILLNYVYLFVFLIEKYISLSSKKLCLICISSIYTIDFSIT